MRHITRKAIFGLLLTATVIFLMSTVVGAMSVAYERATDRQALNYPSLEGNKKQDASRRTVDQGQTDDHNSEALDSIKSQGNPCFMDEPAEAPDIPWMGWMVQNTDILERLALVYDAPLNVSPLK